MTTVAYRLVTVAMCFVLAIGIVTVSSRSVYAQQETSTPTPIESPVPTTTVTKSLILEILKNIFNASGDSEVSPQEQERRIQELSGTPRPQGTPPAGFSPTPGPSPTPGEPQKGAAGLARGLVEAIRAACSGGRVTSANRNCLDNIQLQGVRQEVLAGAIAEMKESARSTGALQCVGFVKAALYIIHDGDSQYLAARGNAIDWLANAPNEYTVIVNDGSAKMIAGDVPVWGYDTYGHIAIYLGGEEIAEGNFDGNGLTNIRATNESSPSLVGWMRL